MFGKGLTAVVADDDPVVQQYVMAVLVDVGFEVELCADLAVTRARVDSGAVDLLVVDKNLPDGSGLELCATLEGRDLGRVIMSSFANVASVTEALQCGVSDYLVKPLDAEDMRVRLGRVVQQLRLLREKTELVAELRNKNEALAGMAVRDPLTHLFNHAYVQDAISSEVSRALRYGHPLSFALIDVDGFSRVNTEFGHQAGDEILRSVSTRLVMRSRASDLPFYLADGGMAARFGGDVFAIILPETERAGAAFKLESVRRWVGEQDFGNKHVPLTVSIGLACIPDDGADREALIFAAQLALEAAKRAGGDQLISYSPELRAQPESTTRAEAQRSRSLDLAMEDGAMGFAYQPIVSTREEEIFGYEALCRPNPGHFAHPHELIGAAVRAGRVQELGRALRRGAIVPMRGLDEQRSLFMNLHPQELNDTKLLSPDTELRSWASRIVLEVTETEAIRDFARARARLDQLREVGFRIALDDLGSGYSGLNCLTQLEPDFVKLDMELIQGIERDSRTARLLKHVVEFCLGEGITPIAEGIETERELDTVIELGVPLVQGFLYAKPSSPFCGIASRMSRPSAKVAG